MLAGLHRVDDGRCRNPSLNLRPDPLSDASLSLKDSDDDLRGERGDWWWTGKHPKDCPGYDAGANVLRSLPLPDLTNPSLKDTLDYFDNCWTLTEVLLGCLQGTDAFFRQPYHQLRHPMIFYYGHVAVVYINKLRVAGVLEESLNQYLEQLLETGVDEMSWDDLSRGRDDWPSVRSVHAYRLHSYGVIRQAITDVFVQQWRSLGNEVASDSSSIDHAAVCFGRRVDWDDAAWAIFMGFEHERIHIETSSVLIRELPLSSVRRPLYWPANHASVSCATSLSTFTKPPLAGVSFPVNEFLPVSLFSSGGHSSSDKASSLNSPSLNSSSSTFLSSSSFATVTLGKSLDYPSFGWDNEYGMRKVPVRPFKCQKYKVTNGEFFAFVKEGGYVDARYWSRDGWGWRVFRNIKWPTFWAPDGPQGLHRYKLRVLFEVVPMQWDWPVDVNYHEARAFALWRSLKDGSKVAYRLLTEAEHMLLRDPRDRVWHGGRESGEGAGGVNSSLSLGLNSSLRLNPNSDSNLNPNANATSSSSSSPSPSSPPSASVDMCMHVSGIDAQAKAGFNYQLSCGSPTPVTALPPTAQGFHDVMGNLWEWAEDHFSAFPGFKPHPYYIDFSSPCFGGLHQMILGGSFMSTGQLASKFARYQFRGHFFQHASFRLVAPEVEEGGGGGEGGRGCLGKEGEVEREGEGEGKEKGDEEGDEDVEMAVEKGTTPAFLTMDSAAAGDERIRNLIRPYAVLSCYDSPQPHATPHGGPCCSAAAAAAAAAAAVVGRDRGRGNGERRGGSGKEQGGRGGGGKESDRQGMGKRVNRQGLEEEEERLERGKGKEEGAGAVLPLSISAKRQKRQEQKQGEASLVVANGHSADVDDVTTSANATAACNSSSDMSVSNDERKVKVEQQHQQFIKEQMHLHYQDVLAYDHHTSIGVMYPLLASSFSPSHPSSSPSSSSSSSSSLTPRPSPPHIPVPSATAASDASVALLLDSNPLLKTATQFHAQAVAVLARWVLREEGGGDQGDKGKKRVLDLGCSLGRGTVELVKAFPGHDVVSYEQNPWLLRRAVELFNDRSGIACSRRLHPEYLRTYYGERFGSEKDKDNAKDIKENGSNRLRIDLAACRTPGLTDAIPMDAEGLEMYDSIGSILCRQNGRAVAVQLRTGLEEERAEEGDASVGRKGVVLDSCSLHPSSCSFHPSSCPPPPPPHPPSTSCVFVLEGRSIPECGSGNVAVNGRFQLAAVSKGSEAKCPSPPSVICRVTTLPPEVRKREENAQGRESGRAKPGWSGVAPSPAREKSWSSMCSRSGRSIGKEQPQEGRNEREEGKGEEGKEGNEGNDRAEVQKSTASASASALALASAGKSKFVYVPDLEGYYVNPPPPLPDSLGQIRFQDVPTSDSPLASLVAVNSSSLSSFASSSSSSPSSSSAPAFDAVLAVDFLDRVLDPRSLEIVVDHVLGECRGSLLSPHAYLEGRDVVAKSSRTAVSSLSRGCAGRKEEEEEEKEEEKKTLLIMSNGKSNEQENYTQGQQQNPEGSRELEEASITTAKQLIAAVAALMSTLNARGDKEAEREEKGGDKEGGFAFISAGTAISNPFARMLLGEQTYLVKAVKWASRLLRNCRFAAIHQRAAAAAKEGKEHKEGKMGEQSHDWDAWAERCNLAEEMEVVEQGIKAVATPKGVSVEIRPCTYVVVRRRTITRAVV